MADPLSAALTGGLRPELVSVTQTGFAAWWPTSAPADTTLRIARADGAGGVRELVLGTGHTVHAASIDDLAPETRYRYELRSGGQKVPATAANPGTFRTLPALEGNLLATIAVLNDMHVGEHCSGTITNLGGQSIPPCFTGDDYAYRMTTAAVGEIAALGPDLIVANGDLTDRGRPADMQRALALLRSPGLPLLITRGNHDRRVHEGPECGTDGDCMRTFAFPGNAPGQAALTSVERVGSRVGVIGLDSCDPETGDGRLDLGDQINFLRTNLRQLKAEGRIPLVFLHHHLALQANITHPPPIVFGVDPTKGGQQALSVLAEFDVPLVSSGHTHRNYLARDLYAPKTWFLENGATKEYPAGYAVLRVYEDGIVRTFHRPVTDFSREWTKTSAGQVFGRQPEYTRGTLASRSFVLRFNGKHGPGSPVPSIIGPLGLPGSRRGLLGDLLRQAVAPVVGS